MVRSFDYLDGFKSTLRDVAIASVANSPNNVIIPKTIHQTAIYTLTFMEESESPWELGSEHEQNICTPRNSIRESWDLFQSRKHHSKTLQNRLQ